MRYGLMAVMTRMIIQGPIFRYVEESMPQIDQRQFKKNTIKEFHAIIRRTPSIGGSKNPFQMTVMFAAFAIAAYKAAQPVINDELFVGMVDAVSYCDTMKKLYVGKNEFSRKILLHEENKRNLLRHMTFRWIGKQSSRMSLVQASILFITRNAGSASLLSRKECRES